MQLNRSVPLAVFFPIALGLLICGCGDTKERSRSSASHPDLSAKNGSAASDQDISNPLERSSPGIVRWARVPELPKELAIMESVFWEPDDTSSLRRMIFSEPIVKNAQVLEIGTGSGLVSLCCLQAGAARVVATDINPAAVENARHNAAELGFSEHLDVRLVPRRAAGAWTVVEPDAQFDVIISNPPWENSQPTNVEEFALYDPDFALLESLVTGARKRLTPNGRMWLAYGCVTAIRRLQELASEEKLSCTILDKRKLDELPEVFLPGMLIEIRATESVSK